METAIGPVKLRQMGKNVRVIAVTHKILLAYLTLILGMRSREPRILGTSQMQLDGD